MKRFEYFKKQNCLTLLFNITGSLPLESTMQSLVNTAYSIIDSISRRTSNLYPSTHIYDMDWDVMLILDACRYDLMKEVAPEFDYLPKVEKKNSVGSKTTEWMDKTFCRKYQSEMAKTAYITGNPNSAKFLSKNDFAMLDEVWRYAWDDEIGTMPMEPITDQAITTGRKQEYSRLLVHYMQPHEPFLTVPELGGSDTVDRKIGEASDTDFRSVWSRLRDGEISEHTVWKHYRENLRRVLDHIELLINNLDAETVIITSDHGNAFGEWGQYGHPSNRPIPSLRVVPSLELSTRDSKTYKPDSWENQNTKSVNSRLRDLGYL